MVDINFLNINPSDYKLIDISIIENLPDKYPEEFVKFCDSFNIKIPNIKSANGKALSAMLKYRYNYWNRETCDEFVKKFRIKTKDSIQLFNKHSQRGIETNSGTVKGKLYIVYPYKLSSKYNLRKTVNFKADKDLEIDKIKSTIKKDYIDVPNKMWQIGHKNPSFIEDNNIILQPPIQGKYRDNYIFIDTLTKIPLPIKLESMIKKGEVKFTKNQIIQYIELFQKLL